MLPLSIAQSKLILHCVHQSCIYCDSRSECYQIENFDGEVLVKENAIELLRKELASKRVKGVIGLGDITWSRFFSVLSDVGYNDRYASKWKTELMKVHWGAESKPSDRVHDT